MKEENGDVKRLTETADSPQLLAVAQELADELNEYIEEEEEC